MSQLEQYQVLHELGRGGQAVTYLATGADGQQVALKKLSLRGADSWKAIELFEREATVLRNLSHPAIPAYVDAFHVDDDDGTAFYLAQELIEGETLQSLWEEDEFAAVLTEKQTLRMIGELAEILVYLHGLNPPVVHRDIKPANIFRRPDGSFALVDFGAVQALVPGTMGGSTFVGTSGYMAPEQLMGRACPGSDIFALGATAIQMLSGFHPGDLPVRRMRMDFSGVMDAPDGVVELIERMTDPDVATRFASAEALLAAVRRLAPGAQTTELVPRPVGDWPQVRESDRRLELDFPLAITNPVASVAMLAGMMSFGLTSVWVMFQPSSILPWVALLLSVVVSAVGFLWGLSKATITLKPDRFELRRRRLIAPDIVMSGRLGTLKSSEDIIEVQSGNTRSKVPVLVLESGVEEEYLSAKKFEASEVVALIEDFQRRYDE